MADGFLGRWSQRKQAQREGRAVEEPEPLASHPVVAPVGEVVVATKLGQSTDSSALGQATFHGADSPQKQVPAPTLEDVKALSADSSYAPFVSRDVAPDVRNAAMRKLFTDPHYNVMDRLDIYIDDYSLPDPMPATMLRQMVSAKFLNLFDEDALPSLANPPHSPPVQEDANTGFAGSMAQSALTQDLSDTLATLPPDTLPTSTFDVDLPIEDTPHDHTDLRLQPDHAARPSDPERVPE
jgi:hypothetical protein